MQTLSVHKGLLYMKLVALRWPNTDAWLEEAH